MRRKYLRGVALWALLTFLQLLFSPFYAAAAQEKGQTSGKIKRLLKDGNVSIALDKGSEAKVGEELPVLRGEALVAKVKVVKVGPGWCIAKILSVEKGMSIQAGDAVSVSAPKVAETKEEVKKEEKETEVVLEEVKEEEGKKAEEEKEQTLDEILAELQGKKTDTAAPVTEKRKLAVMGFENLSKITDETLRTKALDSMTEALHQTQRFILVERDKFGVALFELKLQETEFFNSEKAKNIRGMLESDLIGFGSIKSVTLLGKEKNPSGALIELTLRIFEVDTSKLLFSLSAVGKSEGQGNGDYHIGQALKRASNFISQKLPGEVTASSALTGMTEVTLGEMQGIKNGQELVVVRDGKEIGKVVVKNVRSMSAEGTFTAYNKGVTAKQGDQVINPAIKDDTPQKKKKGNMLLYGALAVGLLAALLMGGGGGDGGSPPETPNVPPVPPNP